MVGKSIPMKIKEKRNAKKLKLFKIIHGKGTSDKEKLKAYAELDKMGLKKGGLVKKK